MRHVRKGDRTGRGDAMGAGSAGGFTLVETLITLAVAGVLGAAILSLLLGQNRFYEHSDDAIYAQQTIRAAMDLVSSELRMVSATDLMHAGPDSVVARFDLVRLVVCTDTLATGDDPYLFVYDSVTNANLPAGFRGTAFSGPYDSTFTYADGWTGSVAPSAGSTECVNNGAPDTTASHLYRRISGWQGQFGTTPVRGSLVRVYGRLSYRLAASSFGSGLAIWRNQQELVSPFESGASFRYILRDGSVTMSVPSASLDQVETVRVQLTARGEDANRYGVRRQITYDIPLRN